MTSMSVNTNMKARGRNMIYAIDMCEPVMYWRNRAVNTFDDIEEEMPISNSVEEGGRATCRLLLLKVLKYDEEGYAMYKYWLIEGQLWQWYKWCRPDD